MVARSHDRSPSPAAHKKIKVFHDIPHFAPEVLEHDATQRLHNFYRTAQPFKYAIVEKLFQDDLLKAVKDECLSELNFREKETDIYKVNQTGDLASLSYLTPSQISLLPNLLALRNALYSNTFRSFLRAVTGCGPLSGIKQDMSVNSYTKGCHLLNHDDVIGTRRVSYILYMPLPHYQLWQKDWGGALELYPSKYVQGKEDTEAEREPEPIPSRSIPPSWNQFIFFEVQPGRSFHSVEEVVVGGEGEDGRQRLSISGWFHAAQEGEEGYVQEETEPSHTKSSREQLTSTSTIITSYPTSIDPPLPSEPLSEEHTSFLSEYLNSVYLQPRTMKALAARFIKESSLELHSFLCEPFASKLRHSLRSLDDIEGLGPSRAGLVPPHHAGSTSGIWTVKGPPHKWRYCVLRPIPSSLVEVVTPRAAQTSPEAILRGLQNELFPSQAFRAWLSIVSNLLPLGHAVEARRFRPGLDYTLATCEEKEARLDVVLGLTPEPKETIDGRSGAGKGKGPDSQLRQNRGWQSGTWGGWECYMAPHEEEDDPAIYRSGSKKNTTVSQSENAHDGANPQASGSTAPAGNGATGGNEEAGIDDEEAGIDDEEEEEEDDSTLLTVYPGFNRLLLVLRDERVLHFVKYVSAAAEGSRWDVSAEFEIGMIEDDDDDDEMA